jgi:hypothetical protein
MAPAGAQPIGWPFQWGRNIRFTPRDDAEYSAAQLRRFSKYVLARICIENNKDILTRMPHKVQLKALPGETAKERATRSKGDEKLKKLNLFFERPDSEHDWPEWSRPIIEDMLTIDAASIYVGRKVSGEIAELRWVDGASVTRLVDQHGWTPKPPNPAYQQLWQGYPRLDLTTDQLIYRPRNIVPRNTESSFLYGLSPTEQIVDEIKIGIARLQFILDFYTEGSIPGGMIFAPRDTAPDKIKEAQQWLDSDLGGNLAKRRRIQIMQGFQSEGKAEQIVFPKEPALSDIFDEIHIRKVCFAYGTSPQRLMRMINRSCYSEDTETLTDRGWLRYDEVSDDDLIAQFNPEKRSIEFIKPTALHTFPYSGEMVNFRTKRVDVLVTPEHNMWTRFVNPNRGVVYKKKTDRKSSKRTWGLVDWSYHKVKASDVNRDSYFIASASFQGERREFFTIPGVMTSSAKLTHQDVREIKEDSGRTVQDVLARRYGVDQSVISDTLRGKRLNIRSSWIDPVEIKMDDWLEFLGYYLSEGRRSHSKNCYEVGISQHKNSPFCPKIEDCFSRLPFTYKVYLDPNNPSETVEWRINSKSLHTYLKENIGDYALDKKIPREFLSLSQDQLRILFDALMAGDGSWGEGTKGGRTRIPDMRAATWGSYYSISRQLADDVQELALKLGYSVYISPVKGDGNPRHRKCFQVNINMRKEHIVGREKISRVGYQGYVYCFEVPSGIFITRRNGKIAFQGNSATVMQEAAEEEGTLPWLNWLKGTADYIIQVLMNEPEYEFAFDPFMELDRLKQAMADAEDIKVGLYTRNEKRQDRGDDPIDDPMADQLSITTGQGVVPLDANPLDYKAQGGGTVGGRTPKGGAQPKTSARVAATESVTQKSEKSNGKTTWWGCEKHKDSYPRISCYDCIRAEMDRVERYSKGWDASI